MSENVDCCLFSRTSMTLLNTWAPTPCIIIIRCVQWRAWCEGLFCFFQLGERTAFIKRTTRGCYHTGINAFFQFVVSALRCLCIELHPGMCVVVRRPRRWVFRKRMSYWNSFCNPYAGIIVYSSIRRAVNTPEWLRTQLECVFIRLERHSPRHILIISLFGVYQENVFIAKSFIRLLRGIDNFKDENAGKQLDSISRVGRVFFGTRN